MAEIVNSQPAGPTSDAEIAAFEKYIGHALPTQYRKFLLTHNGGRPEPDAFTVYEQEDGVMCFFPLRPLSLGKVVVDDLDELHMWPLHCAWDDLQADKQGLYAEVEFDEALLPIGTDGCGNYLAAILDGERTGAIVFFDHETAEPQLLAESFDDFLERLFPSEVSEDDA